MQPRPTRTTGRWRQSRVKCYDVYESHPGTGPATALMARRFGPRHTRWHPAPSAPPLPVRRHGPILATVTDVWVWPPAAPPGAWYSRYPLARSAPCGGASFWRYAYGPIDEGPLPALWAHGRVIAARCGSTSRVHVRGGRCHRPPATRTGGPSPGALTRAARGHTSRAHRGGAGTLVHVPGSARTTPIVRAGVTHTARDAPRAVPAGVARAWPRFVCVMCVIMRARAATGCARPAFPFKP